MSRSASTAADALGGNRSFTRQERGFTIIEACGDGLTQFDAVVHYEVGPSPPKRNARGAASLGINQRLLKSPNRFRHNVDIDPHKTTHDVLEFSCAEIAFSPNASAMCSHKQPFPGSAGYSTG
jgi:hypothetical protein